jgi:hypothetical protein
MNTSTKQTSNEAECGNKSKPLLAVVFAQWVAEHHFRLYNVENGIYYWKSEDETQTSEELFESFNRYQKAVNCNHIFIGDVCEKCSVMKFG